MRGRLVALMWYLVRYTKSTSKLSRISQSCLTEPRRLAASVSARGENKEGKNKKGKTDQKRPRHCACDCAFACCKVNRKKLFGKQILEYERSYQLVQLFSLQDNKTVGLNVPYTRLFANGTWFTIDRASC